MTSTLLPPPATSSSPKRVRPAPSSIITPHSLWVTSRNHHILRNAPVLARLIQVIETDPRHSGLIADPVSVGKLQRAFEAVAETYVNPFHTVCNTFYQSPITDPNSVQSKVLATLCDLSRQHPPIPGILWHALGHIGTRTDPYAELSLLDDEHYAVGSAALNDAALHGLCMVTRLKTLVDEHLIASVSAKLVHAHNCDCCIEAVLRPEGYRIRQRTQDELTKMYDAFMAQLLSETVKTCGYDLPHVAS